MNPAWRPDAPANFIKLAAVAHCLSAEMDARWAELGLVANTDGISKHHRLLRALFFGDDDNDGSITTSWRKFSTSNPTLLPAAGHLAPHPRPVGDSGSQKRAVARDAWAMAPLLRSEGRISSLSGCQCGTTIG